MPFRQLGALAVALILAGHVMTASAADSLAGHVVLRSYHATAIAGTEHMAVYVPAGYDGHRRYPVIYALHGLPSDDTGYQRLDVESFGRAAEQAGRPAIVVAPQGARTGDRDPEWHDWGPGRDWESVVARGVVRVVDQDFRTIPDRDGRAIVGISAGGYGAAIIGVHRLDTFSVIQSWSGYFHPTNPSGTGPMNVGSPQAQAASSVHTYVPRLRRSFQRFPTSFGFYIGDQDGRFLAENRRLDRQLRAAGVPHRFAVYHGGHERRLWMAHMEDWVSDAVHALRPAR
jgi:enterochelin esterase-like enzyme